MKCDFKAGAFALLGAGPELPEQLHRPGDLLWRHPAAGHCGAHLQGESWTATSFHLLV